MSVNTEPSTASLNAALEGLLRKYSVEPGTQWQLARRCESCRGSGEVLLVAGWSEPDAELSEEVVPLLPWRSEQRFIELRRIVAQKTVTPVLMGRLACHADGEQMPLGAILYRQFDLAEWLTGSAIESLYASIHEQLAANVILRLADGAICSVEAGVALPPGTPVQDRHELIARRGVASDRTVDTQVAQASVYLWDGDGRQQCTDVDFELFGLDAAEASLVRAAYEALRQPEIRPALRQAHRRLRRLVELAFESDRRGERLSVEADSGEDA